MDSLKPRRRQRTRSSFDGRKLRTIAKRMRKTLLSTARRHETITYGTLMRKFGLSRGRVLTATIAKTDRLEYDSRAPGFAALIVRKDTGFPGGGYYCDNSLPRRLRRPESRRDDPRLSKAEKHYISMQQERIWEYYGGAPPR